MGINHAEFTQVRMSGRYWECEATCDVVGTLGGRRQHPVLQLHAGNWFSSTLEFFV